MPLYEKKWWKKLLGSKVREPRIEALKDIQVIMEELQDTPADLKPLLKELHKLEELEKEREVATHSVLLVNLEAQAKVLDKLLERYEFYQNDIDINGLRLKEIAKELLRKAEKAGLKELVREKKKEMKWQFDW